jgi:hypothetical protein
VANPIHQDVNICSVNEQTMRLRIVDVPTNDDASETAGAVRPLVVCAGLVADMFVPPLQRIPEAGGL